MNSIDIACRNWLININQITGWADLQEFLNSPEVEDPEKVVEWLFKIQADQNWSNLEDFLVSLFGKNWRDVGK